MSTMMDELKKQQQKILENSRLSEKLTNLYEERKPELFNLALMDYISDCERLAINARNFPALYGNRDATLILEESLADAHEIEIETTYENWIHIRMSSLCPGKASKHKKSFLYAPLLNALNCFAENFNRERMAESVIAIRHIYDKKRALGFLRDQDNVDVKTVVDCIKSALLVDDNGFLCSHFYDAKFGSKNMTDIYILPRSDFGDWWEKHC